MGRVAGIIAHEINNPLDTLRNAFYLLRDHPSLDEDARKYTRIADEELSRVAHITRQTLSFYRESKEAAPVLITEILNDILTLQMRLLERNGIVLEKQFSSDGLVFGFPGELKQVFLNLIGNAIQAMPRSSAAVEGALMCGRRLILCVDDEETQLAVRNLVLKKKAMRC
jgi:signal transduction histidine kinase